jgi:hypothetical protein
MSFFLIVLRKSECFLFWWKEMHQTMVKKYAYIKKKIIEATLVMKFSPHTKDIKLIDEHAIEY